MQHEVNQNGESVDVTGGNKLGSNPVTDPKQTVQLDGKSISLNMILGPKESKKIKSEQAQYLKKMSHLHLENKKIEIIENLQNCPNLTHVYLQENLIYTLVNDPFKSLANIVQLNLYENQIDQMEGFLELVNLKRLYLEKNQISKLDGLDNCRKLEELYLGNQELPPGTEFTFDEYSLAAISNSLRFLELPNSNVVSPKPLYYLE